MPQQNGIGSQPVGNYGSCSAPFDEYDYGYAGYFRNGIFWVNTTYPYVFPNFPLVCQIQKSEPYLNGVVVGLETQLMAGNPAYCDGKYDYAGQAFAECLTKSQREVALTNLAENQTKYDYIFIYPIVIGEHSIQYDAQQDGTLGLMEQLINEYN